MYTPNRISWQHRPGLSRDVPYLAGPPTRAAASFRAGLIPRLDPFLGATHGAAAMVSGESLMITIACTMIYYNKIEVHQLLTIDDYDNHYLL